MLLERHEVAAGQALPGVELRLLPLDLPAQRGARLLGRGEPALGGGDGFGRGVPVARPRSRRVDERAEFGAQRMLGVLAVETGDLPIELGDVEEGDLVVCRCRCHVSALSEESGCKMAAAG